MMKVPAALTLALAAAAASGAPLTPSDWAAKPLGISPEAVRTVRCGRRLATWYRHAGDPAWGGRTDYVDRFAISAPVSGEREGAPLLVVLHWRGAGMPSGGIEMQVPLSDEKGRVFSAPDDFYVLSLDDMRDYNVLLGRTHDEYWWGATSAYKGPAVEDVPRLMKGATPCERRVMDTVEWTVRAKRIDRDRIYLCGNSMGGQAVYAIGLAHGEVFAALNANVPATVWYAAARLGFVKGDGRDVENWDVMRFAEPPPIVDWSGVDDVWSRDREVMYRNLRKRKWQVLGLWGDYGHCGLVDEARLKNDLVEKFDWLAVRRNEAYPAFTDASCDDVLPWPFSVWEPVCAHIGAWKGDVKSARMAPADGAKRVGQVNAFFRWRSLRDDDGGFAMELRIAGPEELGTVHFAPPGTATADVTVRRIQSPALNRARRVSWSFGDREGVAERDANGALTIPSLTLSRAPGELRLVPL